MIRGYLRSLPAALLLLPLMLAACSDSDSLFTPGPGPGPDPDAAWVPIWTQAVSSYKVWMHSPTDIFVMGINGHISHFDGTEARVYNPPLQYGFRGIWGFSATDIRIAGALGTVLRFDGTEWEQDVTPTNVLLQSIWGLAENDVYAVGDDGTILHYDAEWSSMGSGTTEDLYGVHGSDDGHMFAVGTDGVIVEKPVGGSWGLIREEDHENLSGVWVASATEAVAVGYNEFAQETLALFYNGTDWTSNTTGLVGSIKEVFGVSMSDIRAVGDAGVFHFNGTEWTREADFKASGIHGIPGDGYVITSEGDATLHPGSGPQQAWRTGLTSFGVSAIHGLSETDILIVGPFFDGVRYDGTTWQPLPDVPLGLRGLASTADDRIFAVGRAVYELQESGFTEIFSEPGRAFTTIFGIENHLFAVGEDGLIAHQDGGGWTTDFMDTPGRNAWLHDVDGTTPDNVYAVGTEQVFQFDGNSWTELLKLDDTWFLSDIAVVSPEEIYVRGSEDGVGRILRYDGQTWETDFTSGLKTFVMALKTTPDGGVIGVGSRFGVRYDGDGMIMRRTGPQTWEIEQAESRQGFEEAWVSDTGTIFAAGMEVWRPNPDLPSP